MPFTPTEPPLLQDENANELGKWMKSELERLAASIDAPDIAAHKVLNVEPPKPREGMLVVADGTNWDPGDGPGQYLYIGGAWVIQRAGPEPSSYGIITDGTTPAPADIAADTFKLRAATGLTVVTQNDDATHGDNALFSLALGALGSVAPALGDKVPFADISNADANARTTFQILLDLIGALGTEASPDWAADFLALYDASGAVAAKVALSHFAKPATLISSTNLSGGSVDIALPTGYTDIKLIYKLMGASSNGHMLVAFSEDGGSTFITQTLGLFTNGAQQVGSGTTGVSLTVAAPTAGQAVSGVIDIHNYLSSTNKLTTEHGVNLSTLGWAGTRHLTSTAPIDTVQFAPAAGNFDQGLVEVWGIQ